MENIVWVLGALFSIWGIVAVIVPVGMKKLIQFLSTGFWVYPAAGLKILIGLIFLVFARDCRIPWIILTVGIFTAGGSILFCLIPRPKIRSYLQWCRTRPLWLYRVWAVLAAIFGGILLYAGVPAV